MLSTPDISDIRLFNLVKSNFGEKEAEEFVAMAKEETEGTFAQRYEFVTKDILDLRNDLFHHFASGEFVEGKYTKMIPKYLKGSFKVFYRQLFSGFHNPMPFLHF